MRAELGGELGSVKLFFKMAKIMWFFSRQIYDLKTISPDFSIGFLHVPKSVK